MSDEIERLKWENARLRDQWAVAIEDAQRWLNSFENAMRYLAALNVPLAEIATDDFFRIWELDVGGA